MNTSDNYEQSGTGVSAGRVLGGRYRLDALIAGGGMGEVYRATRLHIGDQVAVKVLRAELVDNAVTRERFQREARAAARLRHPNAVVIHDFGEEGEGPDKKIAFIVMELLDGRSLRQVLDEEGPLEPLRVNLILTQICAVLAEGHKQGIIHRDLKPENVVVTQPPGTAEQVKLLDFGIAKLAESGPNRTATSALMGTPKYMSPEQARGAGSVDEKTDVYALGVMLFELLAGRPPFLGEVGELIAQHLYAAPPPLASLVPNVSPAIAQLVARLLEKERQPRPNMTTAHHELQEQLSQCREQDFPAPSVPPVSAHSIPPQKEHSTLGSSASQLAQVRKRVPLYGIGVAAGVLGIGGWVLFHSGSSAPPAAANPAAPTTAAADANGPPADAPRLRWSIKTTPPAAQVLRAADQHEVGQTPWSFAPPPGSGDQSYIVRLKGYHDQTLHFRANADSEQSLILERKGEGKKAGHPKVPPKPAAEPAQSSTPLFTPKAWMQK